MAKQNLNKFTDLVWSVTEEDIFKDDLSFEFHSFVHIISGEMKVIQADKSFTFGTKSTLLFPRNQISTVIKSPLDSQPYKSIVFRITIEQLKSFYSDNKPQLNGSPDYGIRTFDQNPLLFSFFSSVIPYFDLKNQLPETLAKLKMIEAVSILRMIDHSIDNVLSDFSEPGKMDLVDFMEKHYKFNMPLSKFGYLTGRSVSTFNRDFRKTFNMTPQRWLTRKRLEFAHYQLYKMQANPSEIYLEIGFENLSHFSFAFKKQFGYSPSDLKLK